MPAAHPPAASGERDGTGVVAIVGSGFGGAVVARRLSQANRALDHPLRLVLLERGRRFDAADFPRIQLPDYLTDDPDMSSSKRLPEAARLAWTHDQGLWQIRDLRGLRVAVAAGYGGGSLIYASVHLRPPATVFCGWPQGYSRATLDPYYQLAEAMLDVKPAPSRYPKTEIMLDTATRLKRDGSFFLPPIAVTFDQEPADASRPRVFRDNGFGVEQSGCIGCGDCIIGCPHHAKNTLDHNYLAGIEEMGVDVRTLSEAIHIEPQPLHGGRRGFTVVYRDHLRGGVEQAVAAEYVFVCAGAMGSTELLLRSRDALDGGAQATGLAVLGERFFANGDAPGVIFGTAQPWAPSTGPTITTSLYYAEKDQWFLLQDGAVPPTLRRSLGFLQSPLWFKRNAFGGKSSAPAAAATPRTLAGLQELGDTLASLPRLSRALAEAALGDAAADDSGVTSFLPKSVQELFDRIGPPGEALRRTVTEIDHGVVDRLAAGTHAFPLLGPIFAWVIRWFGHRPEVVDATIEELVYRFAALATVRDAQSAPMLGIHTLIDLVLGPPPTESTALLLAMGPDSKWKLTWNRFNRQLTVTGDMPKNVALYGMQERVMRDYARALGGELRTNPGWTLGKSPITVHAQGGCSMGDGDGVTLSDGLMVRGIDGLYVYDASVFPQSVGVNPSNTIVAVAERNIELFIRHELAGRAPALRHWTAVEAEAVTFPAFPQRLPIKQRQWETGPGAVLDDSQTKVAESNTAVPGLVFKEVMEGFIGRVQGQAPSLDPVEELDCGRFRELERMGQQRLEHVRLELTARIPDIDEAFLHPTRFEFAVTGSISISWGGSRLMPATVYPFVTGALVIDLKAPNGVGSMSYKLTATTATTPASASEKMVLAGVKQLREDPGLDAWQDLTTLYVLVDRHARGGVTAHGGIVYVPLLDVLGTQLPSMDIDGADISAERKTWLLVQFARQFYRGLERIYTIGDL